MVIQEFDILRGAEFDLSSPSIWADLFTQVEAGSWDVLILSPPCGTFRRARFHYAGKFGPRPLRTRAYMRGFPWLRDSDKNSVELANYFVD